MKITILSAILTGSMFLSSFARAEILEKRIDYKDGSTSLIGFEYYDSKITEKAPGVLVFSDWMGLGNFAKDRAKELAALGYRAFAADIYGGGKYARDSKEAGALAAMYKGDRNLFKVRTKAALSTIMADPLVDPARVAAIGFCFGGTAVLELGRSGAPLVGLVTLHGGLESPDITMGKNITGRVLVLHGSDDPFVPPSQVATFEVEMKIGHVKYEIIKYPGAVHAFTNPQAGTNQASGAGYNREAAEEAFSAMRKFLGEVFKKT